MADKALAERGTVGYVDPRRGLWTQAGTASGTDAIASGLPKSRERFLHLVVPFQNLSAPSFWSSGIRGIQALAFQASNAGITAWCGFLTDAEAQQGTVQLRRGAVFGSPPEFTGWVHLWVQPGKGRAPNLPSSTATPRPPFNRRQGIVVHGSAGLPASLFVSGTYLANRDGLVHRVWFVPSFSSSDTVTPGTEGIAAVAFQAVSNAHRVSAIIANAAAARAGRISFRFGLGTVPLQPISGWVHTWSRR